MKNMYQDNTLRFDSSKCKGCAICTKVCPHAVFTMENKKAVLVDKASCMECGACAMNCPFSAISVTRGTGCGLGMIFEAVTGKDIGAGLYHDFEK